MTVPPNDTGSPAAPGTTTYDPITSLVPGAPGATPGATTGAGGQGNPTLAQLIAMLREASPLNAGAGSDELNRAWLAAQAQQNSSILSQATGLMGQNQTNQLRMMELMGQSGGELTDAAQRWRSELGAQQDIQGTRLQQEYAQLMGWDPRTLGPDGTPISTLSGRQQGLAEQNALFAKQKQDAEQLGVYNGHATLANLQWQDSVRQAQAARDLQYQMSREAQNFQQAMQQGQQGWQSGESAAERAARLQLQQGQQGFLAGESAQERAVRLQLAREEQQYGGTQAEAERQLKQSLQTQQLGSQASESALERQIRLQLQGGQLGQQESEFARSYLLQQEDARRKQAELSGYLGDGSGALTEAARAARSNEATQRAALTAQLMQSPKDVFKGGAFFRSLRGADPAAMGLTGGGIAGFNSLGNRLALGMPGTISLDDVANATGGAQTGALAAPGAAAALTQGAAAGTGAQPSVDATGGSTTPQVDATGGTAGGSVSAASNEDEETEPGTSPGGPVGSAIDGQLGDLGMGAGGAFPGRAAAATGTAGGAIPYIDPRVFEEPSVKQMTRELRARGQAGAVGPRRDRATPSMVEVGPYRFGTKTAQSRQNADERFMRGAALLNQRLGAARPGTQPGGPVNSPLWPTSDAGTAAPQLQDAASLAPASSFQAPAAPAAAYAPPDYSAIPSVDPATQQQALAASSNALMLGLGNLAPQTLERQSKSQRGAWEGSLQALGINPDDAMQAYAQSRFANLGNVLSA